MLLPRHFQNLDRHSVVACYTGHVRLTFVVCVRHLDLRRSGTAVVVQRPARRVQATVLRAAPRGGRSTQPRAERNVAHACAVEHVRARTAYLHIPAKAASRVERFWNTTLHLRNVPEIFNNRFRLQRLTLPAPWQSLPSRAVWRTKNGAISHPLVVIGEVWHTLDAGVEVFVDVFAPMGEIV
jgi:hypothetical protein